MKGTANAEPHHHELVDLQMIHQAELIVGIGFPWPVDLDRAGGLAVGGVTQVCGDAAILSLNSSIALKGELPVKKAIVEFNPPPGSSNNGKPAPASS